MVTEVTHSQPSNPNSDGEDTLSTASCESDPNYDGAVVLHDNAQQLPAFGNISVTNSNDVHFGNRTFYQGPVTIKQFLYANGQTQPNKTADCDSDIVLDGATVSNGLSNPTFIPEFPTAKQTATDKSVTQENNNTGILKGFPRLQKLIRENIVILVTLLATLILSLVILTVVLLLKHSPPPLKTQSVGDSDEQEKNTPVDSPIDPETNITLANKLKLVSRLEWVAQPPIHPADPLPTPVPYVIIHHTATENCSSQAQCVFHVRYIQTFHIESKHWWDIGYNFLVGGDGEAYEGRGWRSEGAHSYGYNKRSIGIAFVGTFINYKPPQRQIIACKRLIAKGLELGYIKKDYKLLAAKQLQATQSPGQALYEDMKTWDHWAKTP